MTVSKNTLAPRCELPITSFSVLSENNGIKITINYNNNDQLHFTTFTSMPNEPWLPLVSFLQFALNKTYEDVSMPVFFTRWMSFLSRNQQRQSTEWEKKTLTVQHLPQKSLTGPILSS